MVFLLQFVDAVQTGVDTIQFCRVKVRMVQQRAHLFGYVLQFYTALLQPFGQFSRRRHHLADVAQRRLCQPCLADGSRLIMAAALTVQRTAGFEEGRLDVLGVLHRLALLFQFLLLALRESCILQFVVLELQEIQALPVAFYVVTQLLQLALNVTQLTVGLLISGQLTVVLCNDVNHAQLEVMMFEQQVLVLRVNVNQLFAQFLQQGQADGRVVDEGTALACRCQFAADDGILVVAFYPVVVKKILHLVARQIEMRLYHAFVGSGLDALRVGTLT